MEYTPYKTAMIDMVIDLSNDLLAFAREHDLTEDELQRMLKAITNDAMRQFSAW